MFYHKEIVLKERVDFPASPWSGSRSEGELSEPGQLWDRVLTSPDSEHSWSQHRAPATSCLCSSLEGFIRPLSLFPSAGHVTTPSSGI